MIGSPVGRDDRAGQPLRTPPLDAREIVEARPGLDDDRTDVVGLHQRPRLGQATEALFLADWRRKLDWGEIAAWATAELAIPVSGTAAIDSAGQQQLSAM